MLVTILVLFFPPSLSKGNPSVPYGRTPRSCCLRADTPLPPACRLEGSLEVTWQHLWRGLGCCFPTVASAHLVCLTGQRLTTGPAALAFAFGQEKCLGKKNKNSSLIMKGTNGIRSVARCPSSPQPTHTPAHISCFSALAWQAACSADFEIPTGKVPRDSVM